jgi:hypothetical protein
MGPRLAILLAILAPGCGGASGRPLADAAPGGIIDAPILGDDAARLPVGPDCDQDPRCDRVTGCLAPEWPFDASYEQLPEGPLTDTYYQGLAAFEDCREQALEAQGAMTRGLFSDSDLAAFADRVAAWNPAVFWAPASKAPYRSVARAGDEARAVFGPLPPVDCTDSGSKLLGLEVDGDAVDLVPDPDSGGAPRFRFTDASGAFVKWTDVITACDKPSIAGGVTFCGMNSHLWRQVNKNVSYLALCRKSESDKVDLLSTDPYWLTSNHEFKLLGYIIFNKTTGEVAFFGEKPVRPVPFDSSATQAPPGGAGYADDTGRAAAELLYDEYAGVGCPGCHDNKEPQTITPYVKQGRVGYVPDSPQQTAFSLGEYLPEQIRYATAPYRVIGSMRTANRNNQGLLGYAISDPSTAECTGCHPLTSDNTGALFAAAAAAVPSSGDPDAGMDPIGALAPGVYQHLTAYARQSIQPWMTQSGRPGGTAMTAAEWQQLAACVKNPAQGPDCNPLPLYTACPQPESTATADTALADPSGPSAPATRVLDARDGGNTFTQEVHVTWSYLDSLGGVPTRDDVRFQLAIKEVDLRADGAPPAPSDYPSYSDTVAAMLPTLSGTVHGKDALVVVEDISSLDAPAFTDPPPSASTRGYEVDHPARKGKRYTYRLLAKRFCFDQSNIVYSGFANGEHTFYVDVPDTTDAGNCLLPYGTGPGCPAQQCCPPGVCTAFGGCCYPQGADCSAFGGGQDPCCRYLDQGATSGQLFGTDLACGTGARCCTSNSSSDGCTQPSDCCTGQCQVLTTAHVSTAVCCAAHGKDCYSTPNGYANDYQLLCCGNDLCLDSNGQTPTAGSDGVIRGKCQCYPPGHACGRFGDGCCSGMCDATTRMCQ